MWHENENGSAYRLLCEVRARMTGRIGKARRTTRLGRPTCRKVSSAPLSSSTSGAGMGTLASAMIVRASSSSTPQQEAQSDAPAAALRAVFIGLQF